MGILYTYTALWSVWSGRPQMMRGMQVCMIVRLSVTIRHYQWRNYHRGTGGNCLLALLPSSQYCAIVPDDHYHNRSFCMRDNSINFGHFRKLHKRSGKLGLKTCLRRPQNHSQRV